MKIFARLFILSLLLTSSLMASSARAASGVNNFTISNYSIDYTLGRDADNRSMLTTIETIDALFPSYDQNHGIERAIPASYDGHSTSLQIISVRDGAGSAWNYTTYKSGDNLVVRIGDADKYVHGAQRYVISYTQRDVTRYFTNTRSDEFYWDTNGTGWKVPISSLTVTLHIQDKLSSLATGKRECYVGAAGSNGRCSPSQTVDGYTVQANDLSPGENITLAVGFKQHTFASYQQSLWEKIVGVWIASLAVTSAVAVVLMIWFIRRYFRKSNRSDERITIIPEYVPPKDSSVAASAEIYGRTRGVFSAQLIDLAVRRYITIYQTREKSFFRKPEYELEIIRDIADLKDEEQELIKDIFPATTIGSRLALADLKKNSATIYRKLSNNPARLTKSIRGTYGLRAKSAEQRAWFKRAARYSLIASLLTISPLLLVAALVALVCSLILWPLTDKGLALYHYLEGLKVYIRVAEEERIRMLQSPETAEKIGSAIDTQDSRQIIKLYEKVLPYAMLFGLDKSWNAHLGHYYESIQQSPDWLVGSSPSFNAAAFTSSINSFTTAAVYSTPSSSSSGGSGGGGFSGGGGGGGGGGGW